MGFSPSQPTSYAWVLKGGRKRIPYENPQGRRVNALAAGPLKTMAAKGIPGFERFETTWGQRAPLGWDSTDRTPVAKMACVLLSDYSTATTGEIVHVDDGYHAMGGEVPTEPPD